MYNVHLFSFLAVQSIFTLLHYWWSIIGRRRTRFMHLQLRSSVPTHTSEPLEADGHAVLFGRPRLTYSSLTTPLIFHLWPLAGLKWHVPGRAISSHSFAIAVFIPCSMWIVQCLNRNSCLSAADTMCLLWQFIQFTQPAASWNYHHHHHHHHHHVRYSRLGSFKVIEIGTNRSQARVCVCVMSILFPRYNDFLVENMCLSVCMSLCLSVCL